MNDEQKAQLQRAAELVEAVHVGFLENVPVSNAPACVTNVLGCVVSGDHKALDYNARVMVEIARDVKPAGM